MTSLDGVVIDPMGKKMECDEIDNARIIFRNVEVDRDALLNSMFDVDENGMIKAKIQNKRQRFLKTINALLSGRIMISVLLMAYNKLTLTVTVKYASERLSNGVSGLSDTPIGKFQIFNNQVIPLICKTFIINIGLMYVRRIYAEYLVNPSKYKDEEFGYIIRLCCVIKPLIGWHTCETGKYCYLTFR